MATGTAFGGQCYATQAEAVAMWCSSIAGVSSAGVMSCRSTSVVSSSTGGAVSFQATIRTQPQTGSHVDVVTLAGAQACETYGLDYWAPYQAAWIALVLVIATGRTVIKRFFVHHAA